MMFNAIKFSDISKSQMVSAAKKLKAKCDVFSPSKDDLAVVQAEAFVEKKFVKLNTEDLGNVDKQSVEKLKVF